MPFRLATLVILFAVALRLKAGTQQIPTLIAASLDGTTIHLPQAGKMSVLVIGFSKESSDQAAVWGKKLSAAPWRGRSADYYELAMIAAVPRLFHGLVLRALRKTVPPVAQSRFVAVEEDDKPWKKAAEVTSDTNVYLLVVDGAGQIRWRGKGGYSDELFNRISAEVAGAAQNAND